MNTVITTLLTARVDPQRGVKWEPDISVIAKWARSIRGANVVVLVDEATKSMSSVEIVRGTSLDKSPYFARWDRVLEYLETCTSEFVWVTDGTDVTMLREPWADMRPGTLYVGSEPELVGFWWMKAAHQDVGSLAWIGAHEGLPLLNAGIVGGDLATVTEFVTALQEMLIKHPDDSDMAAFNMTVSSRPYTSGCTVHTVFKSYSDNGVAWWMHK